MGLGWARCLAKNREVGCDPAGFAGLALYKFLKKWSEPSTHYKDPRESTGSTMRGLLAWLNVSDLSSMTWSGSPAAENKAAIAGEGFGSLPWARRLRPT